MRDFQPDERSEAAQQRPVPLDPVPCETVGLIFHEAERAVVHHQLVPVALDVQGAAAREPCERRGGWRGRQRLRVRARVDAIHPRIETREHAHKGRVWFVGFADEAVIAILGERAGNTGGRALPPT